MSDPQQPGNWTDPSSGQPPADAPRPDPTASYPTAQSTVGHPSTDPGADANPPGAQSEWAQPGQPEYAATGPDQPSYGQPAYGQPAYGQPAYGQPAYAPTGYPAAAADPGTPGAGYPPAAYGYPGYGYPGYGYPAAAPTNGLAVASLVVSIIGVVGLCFYGLGGYLGIVGAVLGHMSRRQIRTSREGGDGMALAGVITGWIATAIAVIATIAIVAFVAWAANQDPSTFEPTTD